MIKPHGVEDRSLFEKFEADLIDELEKSKGVGLVLWLTVEIPRIAGFPYMPRIEGHSPYSGVSLSPLFSYNNICSIPFRLTARLVINLIRAINLYSLSGWTQASFPNYACGSDHNTETQNFANSDNA